MRNALGLCILASASLLALQAAAQDGTTPPAATPAPKLRPIRGMRYPAISPDGAKIAFEFRGDIWTVPATGGEAKVVAELPGFDNRPRFSPDGQTIAFDSDTNGNADIYTVPVSGGTPKRITFNSADDILGDWSPDGKSLVFYSARDSRVPVLYTIRLDDGRVRQLGQDEQFWQAPAWSPDGKTIAFARGSAGWARKGYHGSGNPDLYLVTADGKQPAQRLTTYNGTDLWPMWLPDGKTLLYMSDQDGFGNLWKLPVKSGKPVQVTRQRDGYIHYPTITHDGTKVAYETDFSIWTVDLAAKGGPAYKRLAISASVVDAPKTDVRKFTTGAREMEVSPDGTQIALGVRGDIFLMPAAGGPLKPLVQTPANDHDFAWSPDGRSLVYTSEINANSDIYVADVASGQSRRLTTDPDEDDSPVYSEDGKTIYFIRGSNGREIVSIPAGGGPEKVVLESAFISGVRPSPDGRWLAYSKRTEAAITNVFAVPVGGGPEVNVSHWVGNNTQPVWSPDGQTITFTGVRDTGGGGGGFQGGRFGGQSQDLLTVQLAKKRAAASAGSPNSASATPVQIDPDGLTRRIKPLVAQLSGIKTSLVYSPDGKTAYFTLITPPLGAVYSMPVAGGTPKKLAENVGQVLRASGDGKWIYALTPGLGSIKRFPSEGGTAEAVNYSGEVAVNSAEERRQTFDQAWRLLRDSFYDRNMHGVDWQKVRERYRPIVDESPDINDFHLLLTEMIGELNASHTGARRSVPLRNNVDTASLGLWFDTTVDGPGLKVTDVLIDGPADNDDSRIRSGEWVMAVAGKDVSSNEAFSELLNGQAGKSIEVLVNSKQSKEGARTVKITPISHSRFGDLLYDHTVERTRQKVTELSGGRLAYLHIKSMDQPSLERFQRELITEAYDREGLVLDVRWNPGGRIHDELFGLLARRVHVYETPRDALKMTQPFGAFTRPMILLCNQSSFSDAEIFTNGFRENKLGKIVGLPTGGGVIGTGDLPLMDGATTFRVPRTGWQTVNGRNLENWGVPPDFEVDLLPADIAAGHDPQVEKAVAELLKQLGRQPKPKKG